jgi:hypothetical protein
MNYERCETLDELLSDNSATEFLDNIAEIPVAQTQSEFYDWADAALSNWSSDYQPMLTALKRLVAAAPDYGIAMQDIKARQAALVSAETEDAELPEPEIPDPGEAASEAAAQITAPIIEQFQEEHPDLAALMSPEQLTAAATAATAVAISEAY